MHEASSNKLFVVVIELVQLTNANSAFSRFQLVRIVLMVVGFATLHAVPLLHKHRAKVDALLAFASWLTQWVLVEVLGIDSGSNQFPFARSAAFPSHMHIVKTSCHQVINIYIYI